MSKLTGKIDRKEHWLTANDADENELFNLAVARGVADSLDHEIAKRTVWSDEDWRQSDEHGKGALFGVTDRFEPAFYKAWNTGGFVVFDPLAEMTDDERRRVGKAIALAFTTRPAYRAEVVAQVVYADKVETLQDFHTNELHKALIAYSDEVNAGGCPAATLAAHLRSIGKHGKAQAESIEDGLIAGADPLLVWFNPDRPGFASYPRLFARAIWHDEIQPRTEAGPPNPARVVVGDADYWKVPKVIGAVGWSIGGMANIDGNEYANAPGATRYLPRAFAVAPGGKRPSQQTLALAIYEPGDQVSMMVRAVNDTQALVNVDAGKLAALFMVTGHKFNKLPLGELTKLITPTGQRVQKRDRESVARSLHTIRTLGLVLPDNTDVRLFDIRAPHNPTQTTPDQVITWAYTQTFRDALSSFKGSEFDTLNRLHGEFIINITALMNFTGLQGVEMRTYLGACSMFNDSMNTRGQYDASFAPKYTLEQLAAQTNSLSQNAVDLLSEGKATRSRSASKSRDLKKVTDALDYLESVGLIVLKGAQTARQIIAPDEWQEAHNEFRKGGARPDYDK